MADSALCAANIHVVDGCGERAPYESMENSTCALSCYSINAPPGMKLVMIYMIMMYFFIQVIHSEVVRRQLNVCNRASACMLCIDENVTCSMLARLLVTSSNIVLHLQLFRTHASHRQSRPRNCMNGWTTNISADWIAMRRVRA
eukprot:127204-Chlamydomonas_euryale.AAC.2